MSLAAEKLRFCNILAKGQEEAERLKMQSEISRVQVAGGRGAHLPTWILCVYYVRARTHTHHLQAITGCEQMHSCPQIYLL